MTSNERQPGAPPNLILALTAQIAASYLSSHAVTSAEVPGMVFTIRQSLASLGGSGTTLASVKAGRRIAGKQASIPIAMPKPVDPHRSVFADHIVCMECHGKYKTLGVISCHPTRRRPGNAGPSGGSRRRTRSPRPNTPPPARRWRRIWAWESEAVMDVEQNIFRVVLDDAAFEALVTGGDVIMEPADGVEVRIFWARHTRRRLAQPNGPHMSTAHSIFPL